uniref:Variant surface glycoprotein 1125.3104 n=1 Tax=Trypanosoma brucei TaxID=5691 RepID=A0A1J0R9T1_9TRYP|nr:variant surface glycoprotein 1125.3104 [Trypanosoma brucei]
MNTKAVVSALVNVTLSPYEGNGAANVNVREYEAFCNLFTIISARNTLDQLKISEEELQEHKEIVYYNVSTATETYYADKDGTLPKGPDGSIQKAATASWKTEKDTIEALGPEEDKTYKRLKDTPARAAANAQIQHYLRAADTLKDECKKTVKGINSDVEDAKKLLATALYGEDAADLDKNNCKGNWANRCTHTVADGKTVAESLAVAFCCICANTDDNTGHCASTITTQWRASSNGAGATCVTIWGQVKSGCTGRTAPAQITAPILKQALTGLTALYGSGTTQGTTTDTLVLGKAAAATCSDGAANSECISLAPFLKSGKNGITWETNILAAADKIDKLSSKKQRLEMLKQQLLLLKTQAAAAYTLAKHAIEMPSAGNTVNPKIASDLSKQEEKCKKHTTNKTACENSGKCKWKGGDSEDKGECEVDESKVTTATSTAGTKDGAAATTTDK